MRLLLLVLLLVLGAPAVPAAADEWRWPLDGPPAVSRPFVAPVHRYAAGHRGADLPASPGAAVRAAGDGVVSYAGLVAGRGVVVVVHGPLRTTYEPVSALVDVGALVSAGEVVGVLEAGHLECPVLACLHWGLRRGEEYLDPVRLVRPGPVRLLPLDGAVGVGVGLAGPAVAPVARREPVLPAERVARATEPVAGAPEPVVRETRPAPAPAEVRAASPRTPAATTAGLVATAAATVLGAVAAGAALRRRD